MASGGHITARPIPQFKFTLEGHGMPGQTNHSLASAPSLRSRDSSIAPPHSISQRPSSSMAGRPASSMSVRPESGMGGRQEGTGNVRVVVRVRTMLPREIERNAPCLIRMDTQTQETTLLAPPSGYTGSSGARANARKIAEDKTFTFDNSFWSVNKNDPHYADQETIYNALGEEFLDHNFEGYHTCIFAYGQTGSGKSYSMMGTPDNPGLIPRTCEDLFERIESSPSPNVTYSVRVSYFEVYNEHVRDLLVPRKDPPNYLKIRESPTEGPYIKDLTEVPVKSLQEVMHYMRLGDQNRTIASTKMNDTSSRSHGVFTLQLKQIHHDIDTDEVTERMARIRLVDLAGSERANATGASGQRLREGSNINKSLTTLGRVIAALAESSKSGGRKKDVVPYRDSVLTYLLKESLGGNSKTAMIACISPTDYDETLSTLRYADQAKQIRTRAVVNQDSLSSAERDAQILQMQDQIRQLTLNVNQFAQTKRQNDLQASQLEEYQIKVVKMHRLMEEQRQISEAKIKSMQMQNEALQLHLRLAVDSLKNPIDITKPASPPPPPTSSIGQENSKGPIRKSHKSYWGEDAVQYDPTEELREMDDAIRAFVDDLGLYRMKIRDDKSRFIKPLGELSPNVRR